MKAKLKGKKIYLLNAVVTTMISLCNAHYVNMMCSVKRVHSSNGLYSIGSIPSAVI